MSDINQANLQRQKPLTSYFKSKRYISLKDRQQNLQALLKMLQDKEKDFAQALFADLGKPFFEAYATEIGFLKSEINYILNNLSSWVRPRSVYTPIAHQLGSSLVRPEAYGEVLVISPWNYPLQLSLSPLLGALSAGNRVVLKPSEVSAHTTECLAQALPQYLSSDFVQIVQGGPNQTQELLKQNFDYIFFTGSSSVGKLVYEQAAKNLTPVTLELGGKSPVVVDESADLKTAAKRIVWGKFVNAGQTCIAPDYAFVKDSALEKFTKLLTTTISKFYGEKPRDSSNFSRIINHTHVERLSRLLKDELVLVGGDFDVNERYFAPTIVPEPSPTSPLMQEEIFGPILPVLSYKKIDETIDYINQRDKPLALYLFSNNKETQAKFSQQTSSGGICINDTLSHVAIMGLPFGGVGKSGIGAYHGKHSFDTFSHLKPIYQRSNLIDVPLRYPPYKKNQLSLVRKFL